MDISYERTTSMRELNPYDLNDDLRRTTDTGGGFRNYIEDTGRSVLDRAIYPLILGVSLGLMCSGNSDLGFLLLFTIVISWFIDAILEDIRIKKIHKDE